MGKIEVSVEFRFGPTVVGKGRKGKRKERKKRRVVQDTSDLPFSAWWTLCVFGKGRFGGAWVDAIG